jgi:hypothetical protein
MVQALRGGNIMKKVTNLSLANIRNIVGFERREDLDFSDDGNRFRGFEYRGMPITTLRADGETYLCIRVDYLENSFTWNEWAETEEYMLCDEFNGVSDFDLDELIENLEKVIAKVNEMNAKAKTEDVDTSMVELALVAEVEMAEKAIEDFKANFDWFNSESYVTKRYIDYAKSLQRMVDGIKKLDFNTLGRREKVEFIERYEKYGYVKISENDFYMSQLKEAMNK